MALPKMKLASTLVGNREARPQSNVSVNYFGDVIDHAWREGFVANSVSGRPRLRPWVPSSLVVPDESFEDE